MSHIWRHRASGVMIVSALLLAGAQASAQEADTDFAVGPESCEGMYKSWLLNRMIEGTCDYSAFVAEDLGTAVKSVCEAYLPAEVRDPATAELLQTFRDDYDRMGKDALCEDLREGYEMVVDEMRTDQLDDW